MTNKPEVERIKKYLDDNLVEGLLRQMKEYLEALAEWGAQSEYIQKVGPQIGRISIRIAEHFAPEDRRWEIANKIVDDLPGADEFTKKKAAEVYATNIISEVDSEFGREVEELSEAFWKFKKNQTEEPPVV